MRFPNIKSFLARILGSKKQNTVDAKYAFQRIVTEEQADELTAERAKVSILCTAVLETATFLRNRGYSSRAAELEAIIANLPGQVDEASEGHPDQPLAYINGGNRYHDLTQYRRDEAEARLAAKAAGANPEGGAL